MVPGPQSGPHLRPDGPLVSISPTESANVNVVPGRRAVMTVRNPDVSRPGAVVAVGLALASAWGDQRCCRLSVRSSSAVPSSQPWFEKVGMKR